VLSDRGRGLLERREVVHDSFGLETGKRASIESPDPVLEAPGIVVGLDLEVAVGVMEVMGWGLTDDEEVSFPGIATLDWGVWSGTAATVVEVDLEGQELRRA
jgi:hypothetical protein